MQFLEKQFHPFRGFILESTGVESLAELIRTRIDLSMAFVIYHGDDIQDIESPIVGHAGEFRGELLAPIVSYPDAESYCGDENGRKVFMLDVDPANPKIIQVPTGIPLIGMRDSYRYQTAMQKFYTRQSVDQILSGLRQDGWNDFLYTRVNRGPIDFTPINVLRKNITALTIV